MKVSALIGKSLKDPEVIEILEFNDIEVIYDFDRHFESFDSAEDYYKENAINYVTNPREFGSDTHKWWIKCELENIKIHHQFKQGKTNKITIMSHDA